MADAHSNDLGEELYSFAVISDTHVNPSDETCNSPFPVNSRANRRFRYVVADLNLREVSFVLHLGDLVHPVPASGTAYHQAAGAFRDISAELTMPMYYVPGNHDIGDTPVAGGPAEPTTAEMIRIWSAEFGPQYRAFSHGGIRFVLFNAQLTNSGLAEEDEQRLWLEQELANTDERVMLAFHHPLYICAPDEPAHYDNTDPPGRNWLLGLIEKYNVEAAFSGHAHNFWYDRFAQTDLYLAPATSFVRQDYSEMMKSAPGTATEYGRDDRDKLGYFRVTVFERGHTVQIVRTCGAELRPSDPKPLAHSIGPTPLQNRGGRFGFDLRANWAEVTEIAPSGGLDEFERKPARNDYLLLSLIEMGVGNVRIPLSDLKNSMRRKRLEALHHLGIRPTIFSFGPPSEDELNLVADASELLTAWEIAVNWKACADLPKLVRKAHASTLVPVYLSRLRDKEDLIQTGVYYHVINHGFSPDDFALLSDLAAMRQDGVSGAVFQLRWPQNAGTALADIDDIATQLGLRASVHLKLSEVNPALAQFDRAKVLQLVREVLYTLPGLKHTHVFCDTLSDVDRGYFPRAGVVDAHYNPTEVSRLIAQMSA